MNNFNETSLILAAEDCQPEIFDEIHKFSSKSDKRVLLNLVAHGPVLLRGGRGSGKSALMIAASRQLDPVNPSANAIGIYMSLRHAPLLKSTGEAYGRILCTIVIQKIKETLGARANDFDPAPEVGEVQFALSKLAQTLGKRIVLYFDDAAHLGREASLEEFFDIYRTISSSSVSCKAAIYPGVTRFGTRFDVYNDSTVVDLLRSEELPEFSQTFVEVLNSRYASDFPSSYFSSSLDKETVASFLALAVLGNMRGFIFACNTLKLRIGEKNNIGIPELSETLINLAANYYWPLLDEIRPKLGIYEPMVDSAQSIAELVFLDCGQRINNPRDILIHRQIDEKLSKQLQILEYAGFMSKREASRALKSGGRGARYTLNICCLLEQTPGARLTKDLFSKWISNHREEAIQFSRGSKLFDIPQPESSHATDLDIFSHDIESLKKSPAYPYGLTEALTINLRQNGYETIGALVEASDEDLDKIPNIGKETIIRIRNVLGQAIWM